MKTTLLTLSFALVCALVIHATPPEVIASSDVVTPSFDIAMPAPAEPVDNAPVLLAAKT